jgi:hypothetical protein
MRSSMKRALAGVASMAVVASVAPFVGMGVASAAVTNNGTLSLNPLSGTSSNNFSFTGYGAGGGLTTPQCAGDTASGGYNWSTFMIPASANIDTTLTFGSGGPTPVAGEYRASLTSAADSSTVVLKSTGIAGGAGQPGIITGIPAFTFGLNLPGEIPAGAYKVGIACTKNGGATLDSYWVRQMTVTANPATGGPAAINWAQGAIPAAPAITTVTPGDATLAVAFTASAADPAITSYTLSATPQGGGATVTQTGASSPINLTGLVNGTTYNLSLTATNSAGTSPAGTGVGTPAPAPRAPVTGFTATPGTGKVDLTWVAPTGIAPTGFSLVITPQGGSATTVPLPAGTTSYSATGLAAGTNVSFQLTPLHPAPYTAPSSTVSSTPLAAQVLIQDITVTRPVGALVLTQVCGAYGSLAAETAQLGFPAGLPLAPAVNSSTVAAPTAGGTAPTLGANGTGGSDPVRGQYPYPTLADGTSNATYPTHCGINLGNAQYVRSGAGAGQFFAAEGRLNQVTVVDTRDGDLGWNVVGQVSNFSAGAGKSFSGSQLGWTPVKTEDTASFIDSLGNTYDQLAAAGGSIAPNTAVAAGLSSNRTLISAAPFAVAGAASSTGGLGTAIADARLKLLIPVTAQSGVYTATLTISTL